MIALLATRTPTVDDFRGHPSESKTARGATLAGVLHGFEYSYVCTRKKSHPWIPLSFSKPQCGFCLRKQTPRRFPHEAFSMFSEPHSIALPAPSGAFRKAGCGLCTHARAVRRIIVSGLRAIGRLHPRKRLDDLTLGYRAKAPCVESDVDARPVMELVGRFPVGVPVEMDDIVRHVGRIFQ